MVEIRNDGLWTFSLDGEELHLRMTVLESQLAEAGYTPEDVEDINTDLGIENLLEDLGLSQII